VAALRVLHPHGDYFAINVSSPNTPGLRALQDKAELTELLSALRDEVGAQAAGRPPKPLVVKLSPDLTDAAVAELLAVCLAHGVSGVIAGNTTLARDGVADADPALTVQAGGLSGRPLATRALALVGFISRETGGALPVIGVGGVLDADAALRLFDAGASLVQLYTGFVYRGPGLIRSINRALLRSNP
jgi:dihydroorotate dehydrogenase